MKVCSNNKCSDYNENQDNNCEVFENINGCLPQGSQSAFDAQVGGTHYKQYKIQPYDFFFKNDIPHHKAAIIRRILRYDHPTGKGKEDLEKIRHEIDLIMELEGWR